MNYSITNSKLPEALELSNLFNQTKWANKRTIDSIDMLLKNVDVYVTIRSEDKLIGFGRAITDRVYRALIDDIVVDINYRKEGLGGLIIKELMKELRDVQEVYLNTGEHLEKFYNAYGFKRAACLTMKF